MLAAGTQAQAEARLVQHHIRDGEDDEAEVGGDIALLEEHRADEGDIAQNRYFGNAEGIDEADLLHAEDDARGVDGKGGRQQIDGSAGNDLIGTHINRGIGVEQGDQRAGGGGDEQRQQQLELAADEILREIEEEHRAESAEDHDAFQRHVDDAGAFGEHTA